MPVIRPAAWGSGHLAHDDEGDEGDIQKEDGDAVQMNTRTNLKPVTSMPPMSSHSTRGFGSRRITAWVTRTKYPARMKIPDEKHNQNHEERTQQELQTRSNP